jgi:hypothetical protein
MATLTRLALTLYMATAVTGCASIVSNATNGMAENLSTAILNQDDPETVRDGAPAYLLMMDSFVEGAPENVGMLSAAAELYAAYGIVFVDDADRAKRLTGRSLKYARRAMCSVNPATCGMSKRPFDAFEEQLQKVQADEAPTLFTLGLSWLAYIQAHRDDWAALADLPKAEAALLRVRELDPSWRAADREHYLAVLNTIRPPALGGKFDAGRDHYEQAIELTNGRDLAVKVDFARYYARTLYDRELHDELLKDVLESNPEHPGHTLFNTLAQREARILLETADDYF